MVEKELFDVVIPREYKILRHRFHNYDPSTEYSEEMSFEYLAEDLFQVRHWLNGLTIDLGWYGDLITNKGEFTLRVILKSDWENPITTLYSKSQPEIAEILQKTITAINDGAINFEPEKK